MIDIPAGVMERALEVHRDMDQADTWPETYEVLALSALTTALKGSNHG